MTSYDEVVPDLTAAEKVDLLSGQGMWRTHALPGHGVPSIVMTDGTYGVRYSIPQIDGNVPAGQDFEQFLAMMAQPADYLASAWGALKPATCFPNGSSFACSWDVGLAASLGAALAEECQALGIHVLLGPGINLRRTPLAGRGYEYYSEDPVVSGDLAGALIAALQDGGVGASLKHFAANNSEIERTTMDSVVEERALREVYLLGFERAVRRGRPWTVMSSYNRLNGVQTSADPWLLTTVLRDEWGFDGVVVSDWHGIKDRVAALLAGNDLDMPESEGRRRQLADGLAAGAVPAEVVDEACRRVLRLVARCVDAGRPRGEIDVDAHHALARRMAAESLVLLKNDGVLPLAGPSRIAVVGAGALDAVIQGTGSATTAPARKDVPLDELRALAGEAVVTHHPDDVAAGEVADADVVVVFAHTESGADGEGADRRSLALAPGQDELIARLAAAHPRVVVVLANSDAVAMPWLDDVAAVVECFFAGQAMGGAVADVLFGVVNPSGKLTVTFPRRVEDVPGWHTYPGEGGRHVYSEGLYVGYRWYDKRLVEPLFPFGFGLSYTTFSYGDVRLSRAVLAAVDVDGAESVDVVLPVTNTGTVAGAEVVQVYVRPGAPRLARPVRELRGFAKVWLQAGESREVTVTLTARDFAVWDPAYGAWVVDSDDVTIEAAASSRDVRSSAVLHVDGGPFRHRPFTPDIQPVHAVDNPVARDELAALLERKTGASRADCETMLDGCRTSFFGIFTTFERRFRVTVTAEETAATTARIRERMGLPPL